jgi:uncharacterized protein YcaQ
MQESLPIELTRKLVLHSQQLPPAAAKGTALSATLAAIQHLSYIQIDTISVIQRAHHHTLWNRNPRYKLEHLDQLLEQKEVFEYWSHAAAYLPMQDYRHSLFRKNAIASGEQNHWYKRDEKMMKYVLERIESEGPLMAKDFEYKGKKLADWGSKPAKQALEYLFMQGDLMVPKRNNFHKVYDLTERVLTADINTNTPTAEEHIDFLIKRYLNANGVAKINECFHLIKQNKPLIQSRVDGLLENNELIKVVVKMSGNDSEYLMLPESYSLLEKPLSKRTLKILSPFDNLLIQRKRMTDLFSFDYQIECYVPQQKRQYGYFVLPLLWGGRFAGRLDCKADRKTGVLNVHYVFIEAWIKDRNTFAAALETELAKFMAFNGCNQRSKIQQSAIRDSTQFIN